MITTVSGRITPKPNMKNQISMTGGAEVLERASEAVGEQGVRHFRDAQGAFVLQMKNVKGVDTYEQLYNDSGKLIGENFIQNNGVTIEKKLDRFGCTVQETSLLNGSPLIQKHYDRIKNIMTRFIFGEGDEVKTEYFKINSDNFKEVTV